MPFAIRCALLAGFATAALAAPPAYDARLSGVEYAFPVATWAFESQGQPLEMAYMHLPAEPGKPTVTLLHGKNFTGHHWAETARWLHEQGWGVLMPDQIGFGKSSKPADYQFSFAALAANTRALQQELGLEPGPLVGHSMGGMLAVRFALQYPEAVERLVLVNPIGLEDYLQWVQYKDVSFFEDLERGKTPEAIVAYQRTNYYDGAWNERYEVLTEFLAGQLRGPDADRLAKVNARTYDMIFTQPVIHELGNLQVPTTLIAGTRDRTGPGRGWMRPGVERELGRYDRLGREAQQRLPSLELVELDGLGHVPQVEDFARFADAFGRALGSPEAGR